MHHPNACYYRAQHCVPPPGVIKISGPVVNALTSVSTPFGCTAAAAAAAAHPTPVLPAWEEYEPLLEAAPPRPQAKHQPPFRPPPFKPSDFCVPKLPEVPLLIPEWEVTSHSFVQ